MGGGCLQKVVVYEGSTVITRYLSFWSVKVFKRAN